MKEKIKPVKLSAIELREIKEILVKAQRFELAAKIRDFEYWANRKKKIKMSLMIKKEPPTEVNWDVGDIKK